MKSSILLAATAAAALLATSAAQADPNEPYGSNPDHYYSQNDHNGYYDHSGTYHEFSRGDDRDNRDNYGPPPPPPGQGADNGYQPSYYYDDGDESCYRQNQNNRAAGTIFGAFAGGLLGAAVSHGNGGAVVGGAVLGGLVGNNLSSNMDCQDRPYAYNSYYRGLNGDIGVRVDWRNDRYGDYGYFTPTREFNRGGERCRDYDTITYRHGREVRRSGTACRRDNGNWYFD